MSEERKQAYMILNSLPGLGPITIRRLLQFFDQNPSAILHSKINDLLRVEGVGEKIANTIVHFTDFFDLDRELTHLQRSNTRFISCECDEYPKNLLKIDDSPIGFYAKGKALHRKLTVGIVGTRQPSVYGMMIARKLSAELAEAGVTIISGLARGIDRAAHEGALSVDGDTIGVLGCGINIIYPPEHVDLFKQMESGGTILSEFPFNRRADKQTFPRRNRIIAGMCDGLLVVESASKGGSMITARLGMEYGKSVMAIPGRIDQINAEGCHALIRDGATLVTSARQIVDELSYERQMEFNFSSVDSKQDTKQFVPESRNWSAGEARVIEVLQDGSRMRVDAIASQTGLAVQDVSTALMMLEISGAVKKGLDSAYEIVPNL